VTNRNELWLDAFYFIFIIIVLLAGKPRFKGWLEGVRTGACHRSSGFKSGHKRESES
jgi:hypothetical protein